ncbi:MAG: TrmH family RNA methyltransferase [Planctomycetia bacterium]
MRDRHQSKSEEKYHGIRACEAIVARRRGDIVRVYVAEDRRGRWADLLAWCARDRRGFQVVPTASLERLSGSTHHEGIVILARAYPRLSIDEVLSRIGSGGAKGPLVYLDGVQNPHNLGAILRTAAHFGACGVLGAVGQLPPLSPAAVRVAEGAAEHVPVCGLSDPVADLVRLKAMGYRVVATSSRGGVPPTAALFSGRTLLVLGSEAEGVSGPLRALADATVAIPGTGAVESLNVSVACGVLLAAAWSPGRRGGASD